MNYLFYDDYNYFYDFYEWRSYYFELVKEK